MANKLFYVRCLETGKEFGFMAITPLEAIQKMVYTLDQSSFDKDAKILLSKTGKHLFVTHSGQTYGIATKN